MNTQRRIQRALFALIGACVGVLALASGFGRNAPIAIVATVLACVVIDSIWNGRVSYGLRDAKRIYCRRERPFAYWVIVLLYAFITLSTILAAFIVEPKTKPEPNNAMERSRIAVTDCAGAHSAPATRLAHL